jgi:(+)-abscisic acid 8'-hydroxylase
MDFSGLFLTLSAAALFLCLLRFIAGVRRSSSTKLPLPPGTMGYPYVGETFQLYSQDPNVFFAAKQRRSKNRVFLKILKIQTLLSYKQKS